jgi:CBS domain-containing protein
MKAQDIMTEKPACCTTESNLQQAAQMMVDCDCGEIPVTEGSRLVGVVTDRDIACRAVAKGRDPLRTTVGEIMSTPVMTVPEDADLDECCRVMEAAQVRRVPVVDRAGNCRGIVSQADIARRGSESKAGEVVRDVSRPSTTSSRARAVTGP